MKSLSYENAVITTFAGLEDLLSEEIRELGGTDIQKKKRAVAFKANKEIIYNANFKIRTGLRILVEQHRFRVDSDKKLYDKVKDFDWNSVLTPNMTFSVSSVVNKSDVFNNSNYASLKVKDAIVDVIRNQKGLRPNIDSELPNLKIHIHIDGEDCELYLDTTGESMHRRGYRVVGGEAPINEVLASAMIQFTGWKGECDFINPMCGSGTLLIEAAMVASNTSPGMMKRKFAMKQWLDYDRELWKKIYKEEKEKIKPIECRIYGYDFDDYVLAMAKSNISNTQFDEDIIVANKDFFKVEPLKSDSLVIINPPYDERMKTAAIEMFYKNIGDNLKLNFVGSTAWIISGNMTAMKKIGLAAEKKIPLVNGRIDCSYRKYSLYEGSRKENESEST